jgi:SOS response regulatory protein OraA/RecX
MTSYFKNLTPSFLRKKPIEPNLSNNLSNNSIVTNTTSSETASTGSNPEETFIVQVAVQTKRMVDGKYITQKINFSIRKSSTFESVLNMLQKTYRREKEKASTMRPKDIRFLNYFTYNDFLDRKFYKTVIFNQFSEKPFAVDRNFERYLYEIPLCRLAEIPCPKTDGSSSSYSASNPVKFDFNKIKLTINFYNDTSVVSSYLQDTIRAGSNEQKVKQQLQTFKDGVYVFYPENFGEGSGEIMRTPVKTPPRPAPVPAPVQSGWWPFSGGRKTKYRKRTKYNKTRKHRKNKRH